MAEYLSVCEGHIERLISSVSDSTGKMWPSVVDVWSLSYPEGNYVPQRVYRLIGAPRGSTLYWDQPILVSAYLISELTGKSLYAFYADSYVNSFLSRCIAENGMFQWGNHQYYSIFEQKIISFSGGYHEL